MGSALQATAWATVCVLSRKWNVPEAEPLPAGPAAAARSRSEPVIENAFMSFLAPEPPDA
jgi:hypothetical protein